MATKVNGKAIKEGSIPMSALSLEVKNKIENAGAGGGGSSATPDWNAQEEESGYIKNKPFDFGDRIIDDYMSKYVEVDIHEDGVEKTILILEAVYNEEFDNTYWDGIDSVGNGDETFVRLSGTPDGIIVEKIGDLPVDTSEDYIISGLYKDSETGNIMYGAYFDRNTTIKVEWTGTILPINKHYLPNDVLKTTPQELSDKDKNQALANLGIDPIVWKYMCEPYHLSYQNKIPDDLRSVIFDEDGNLKDIVLKLVVVEINDDSGHYIYSAAKLSGDRRAVVPSDDYTEYAVSIYPDGTTSDW